MIKKYNSLLLILLSILFIDSSLAQDVTAIKKKITILLSDTALQHATIAFTARNISDSTTIISLNGNKSLVPASIQKVITTGVALETLDSTFQFTTRIGYVGSINNAGVLNGDVYMYGSGDPTIGSQYFNKKRNQSDFLKLWTKAIKENGIKEITGKIVLDISHFEDWPVVSTWTYEDLGNYYGAGVYGIMLLDNLSELHFSTSNQFGTKTVLKYSVPELENITIDNQVTVGKGGDNAYVFLTPTSDRMIVRGDITPQKSDFIVKACIPNPPQMMADLLYKAIDSMGIKQTQRTQIISQTNKVNDARAFTEIYTHRSPKLSKIIEQTNYNSVNLFAETLLKETGNCVKGNGSTQDGLVSLYEFCHAKKIKFSGVELVDGSGLSRFNLMTTNFMVDFLTYYKNNSPYFTPFFNSLPVSGQNGTMENFGKKSDLIGTIHAKTGSMTRVKNLAGYLITRSGKWIAFSFMANNYNCGGAKVKAIQEEVLKVLFEL